MTGSFRNDLRRQLQALPLRPPEPPRVHTRPLKRRPDRAEIDLIVVKYRSGISTNQLAREHHLSKRTISALLGANAVHLRRQRFTEQQAREAATLYIAGRTLAWIADHFGGLSPTTVARCLRRQGVQLRPRRGF
jgi:hypothetical protein